jgi:hypothetical protein
LHTQIKAYNYNMKNVAPLKNANKEISNLFSFVSENNFHEFTTLSEMRELIRNSFSKILENLTNEEKLEYAKKLQGYNFYLRTNYDIEKESNIYVLMNNLSNFRDEVVNHIDINYNSSRTIHKLIRNITPPLEAYDFVGLSKIKITPSGKEYGLLFE